MDCNFYKKNTNPENATVSDCNFIDIKIYYRLVKYHKTPINEFTFNNVINWLPQIDQ